MRRINRHTVEYSDQEMPIVIARDAALDAGHNMRDAARIAIETVTTGRRRIWLEPGFVVHISDRTLRYDRVHDQLIEQALCGHPEYAELRCAEMTCPNYIEKHRHEETAR